MRRAHTHTYTHTSTQFRYWNLTVSHSSISCHVRIGCTQSHSSCCVQTATRLVVQVVCLSNWTGCVLTHIFIFHSHSITRPRNFTHTNERLHKFKSTHACMPTTPHTHTGRTPARLPPSTSLLGTVVLWRVSCGVWSCPDCKAFTKHVWECDKVCTCVCRSVRCK